MKAKLIVLPLLLAAVAAHPAAASVVAIPAELDLGTVEPAAVTSSSVWLVNTAAEPVELLSAKGSCGCTVVEFEPRTLARHEALRLPVRVTAPKAAGRHESVTVTVTPRDGEPIRIPVRLVTAGDLDPASGIAADPPVVDLGPVAPGSLASASARLVNAGDMPHRVTAARPSCKCVTLTDFAPAILGAGEAMDVHLEVETPETLGAAAREITFVLEGRTLVVPVQMETTDPRLEALRLHLESQYPSRYTISGARIEDDALTAIACEGDDHHPGAWVTCRFKDDGSVDSLSIEPIHS